ncbi:hypothetical protein [Roseovarius sp. SYSU LYC5161]|uniref:hypothetical protein n=1 Tax=Roseovarius halophilus (ex Wu et al. 2025) TaxID=3376060 RepID=UPI002871B60D|nr:hypothetical protein [Roseovarius sp.]
MRRHDDDIAQLTGLVLQARQAELRAVATEEAALRRALAALEERRHAGALRDPDHMEARSIGADVAWRGWMEAKRAEMNRQLALVLARKSHQTARVTVAHGRDQAATLMRDAAVRQQHHRRQQRQDLQADHLIALTAAAPRRR